MIELGKFKTEVVCCCCCCCSQTWLFSSKTFVSFSISNAENPLSYFSFFKTFLPLLYDYIIYNVVRINNRIKYLFIITVLSRRNSRNSRSILPGILHCSISFVIGLIKRPLGRRTPAESESVDSVPFCSPIT